MSTMRAFGSAAAAALLLAPASAAANDDLVRGLIGIGSAIILNQAQQQPQRRPDDRRPAVNARRAPSYGSPARPDSDETRFLRAEVQRRLNALGFDAGQPDGVYGPRTRRAIARFQASVGRTPDGILSRAEVAALYAATGDVMPGSGSDATAFDGGGSSGFPQLGGAPAADGSAESGGFPALGTAGSDGDSPTQAGFPKLGSAGQGASADTGGAFPTLGAPAERASAGGAFPALGKAPQEQAEDGAMPGLGAPPKPEGTAFPGLTNTPPKPTEAALPAIAPAPEQEDASFPQTAQPPAAQDVAMPGLAAPPEKGTGDVMPKLGDAPPEKDSAATRDTTLDREIARTVFRERAAQPTIAGISLGQKPGDAVAALKKNGFVSCEKQATSLKCSRATDTLKDTILLWTAKEGVWAVRRTIEFANPAPADFVMQQFRATYPQLLANARRSVTSGRFCHAADLPDMGLASLLGRMDKVLGATGDKLPDDIVGYAQTCPLIYMIGLEGSQTITAARLTFIDATPFIRRGMAEQRAQEARDKANREKLSNDLKL